VSKSWGIARSLGNFICGSFGVSFASFTLRFLGSWPTKWVAMIAGKDGYRHVWVTYSKGLTKDSSYSKSMAMWDGHPSKSFYPFQVTTSSILDTPPKQRIHGARFIFIHIYIPSGNLT
jgi:hypothetical protein